MRTKIVDIKDADAEQREKEMIADRSGMINSSTDKERKYIADL